MLDCKVINWMLKGSIEYNKILREFDKDLIVDVFGYEFRPVISKVTEYYSRHKATPTVNVLSQLLPEEEFDHGFLELIENYETSDNEIGFYVDQMKERYNKRILKRLVNTCLEEDTDVLEVNKDLKKIVGKTDRLYKSDVFSEGMLKHSIKTRLDNYEFVKNNPNLKQGMLSDLQV